MTRCSICRRPYSGDGNSALPVNSGRCCHECNRRVVYLARIEAWLARRQQEARQEEEAEP